jgi:hypothetical protein
MGGRPIAIPKRTAALRTVNPSNGLSLVPASPPPEQRASRPTTPLSVGGAARFTCNVRFASLLGDDGVPSDLGAAIAQHEELVQARPGDDSPGEMDRSAELETPPRRVCLQDRRRHYEHERALALVESGGRDPAAGRPRRRAELAPSSTVA